MKTLPIGEQDFSKLIRENCVYVDKTELIYSLAKTSGYHFLSRPRRFGKSLLISTLKELFEGNKILFKDLWIENNWDWSQTFPVIHFSFSSIDFFKDRLEIAILEKLAIFAQQFQVKLTQKTYKNQFSELIELLHNKFNQQVVVLIDEYDKPIIQYLEEDSIEQAKKNQAILKNFYSVFKDLGGKLRFLFITGVSKFSKVSLFSDLNQLSDLTLKISSAALTGYTHAELTQYFDDYLVKAAERLQISVAELLEQMQIWYNGYSWDGKTKVYNPFGTLQFLSDPGFRNYWFSTGTPTFLIEQMKKHQYFELENVDVSDDFLEKYDLDNIAIIPLLFQTGYLTVKTMTLMPSVRYVLDLPNLEVRQSLYRFLLDDLAPTPSNSHTSRTIDDLKVAFETHNLVRVRAIINTILADLPDHTFEKTTEGLFHGLVHILFRYLGIQLQSEVHSAHGRADVVIQTNTHVYIFEFKIRESADVALRQIVRQKYADKYRLLGKIIIGIGVKFDIQSRNIEAWKTKKL